MSVGCAVPLRGPLVLYPDSFREELHEHGYAVGTVDRNVRILAHLSCWMEGERVALGELTTRRVEEFVAQRRDEGYPGWLSVPAGAPLMGYLRRLGVAPELEVAVPNGAADRVLEEYDCYLMVERGLTPGVLRKYSQLAREFLAGFEQLGVLDLGGMSAAAVTDHVVVECARRSAGSAKWKVDALRSLLRYLFLAGYIDHQLALAVPTVANWGAGTLPRGISPEAVAALVARCDEDTVIGCGTAASWCCSPGWVCGGEVAALQLDQANRTAADWQIDVQQRLLV